ncbi:MAG: biotin/lipoyl-containing protein [Victivallales bacterium]|jgi:pyruvate dehydrogenase E2 component (dihydrolipoamide acetyltransferase)
MITKVKLPKADANMNEGTIGKWFASEGDTVSMGESLVEVITDKTVFEFEAPKSGILRRITAPENSVIPPGYVLALIGGAEDKLPDVEEYNRNLMDSFLKEKEVILKKENSVGGKDSGSSGKGKVRATPSAKRMAAENQLDLSEIQAMFGVEVVNEKTVQQYLEKKSAKQ